MIIDLSLTADQCRSSKLTGKTAIVIDVLRATSTIVTAFVNGCSSIIPVSTPDEAFRTFNVKNAKDLILAGETSSQSPEGFQLGNSPYEYSPRVVKGKNIILTTTNGTKAINKAQEAKEVYIGSLLNAKAAANQALKTKNDLYIVCAGTRGKLSLEDTIAAGLIINLIKEAESKLTMTNQARTAYNIFHTYKESIIYSMQNSTNGRNLTKLGFGSDIIFCAQIDKYDMIPQYKDGVILLSN